MAEETKTNPQVNKEQMDGKSQGVVPVSNGNEEDSVAQDVGKLKVFVKNLTGQAKIKAKPYQEKVKPVVQSATSVKTKAKANKMMSSFTKISIFVVIIFVTLLLVVIGFSIVQRMGRGVENGSGKETESEVEIVQATPTIIPYTPSSPSIYASDTVILKMDEDIKILGREMFSIPIRESTLYPPSLDFSINFGGKK